MTNAEQAPVAIPPVPARERLARAAVITLIAAALLWSFGPAEIDKLPQLFTYSGNIADYLSGFLTPNFKDWRFYISEMVITVQIAVWGTFLAVVLSVPFGLLSSNNIAPAHVVQPARRLMDAFRAINEFIFAIIFVVAVGLGPFAGVMALFVSTTGTLAKLFSEAVEAIDPRPVEGIRATGATRLQEVIYGVIPQVLPLWSSYALYRFEANVRSATVLGIVGADGIGQVMYESIRGFYYGETAAILIVVIATVSLTDIASQQIRRMLV
jgi:phosphonate transport system permease protein